MNIASLPGIYRYALRMPDMHQGFGFPIGAGRRLSRNEAVRHYQFEDISADMAQHHIRLFAADKKVAREEAPGAYKDVDEMGGPMVIITLHQ